MVNKLRTVITIFVLVVFLGNSKPLSAQQELRHAVLIAGNFTGIIDEEGREVWKTDADAKDATRLENGHLLITWVNRVVEFDINKKKIWSFERPKGDAELVSAWRLDDGHTMIVVLGEKPRLMEVDSAGEVKHIVPLDPEQISDTHMQTRMARPLTNGNYLVPHLLGFSVREYDQDGQVVADFQTDSEHFGGQANKNWPFTAIRTPQNTTLVGCTYGNRVVEFDSKGQVVWELTNQDVDGIIKDACGVQRLPNGNTVVTSYGQREPEGVKIFEVTPEKKVVWTYRGHYAHHFQVLTTNGEPVPGPPLK